MEPFVSQKVKELLCAKYGICAYKIFGVYYDFVKTYYAYIYFRTNKEVSALTEEKKGKIKSIYVDFFKQQGYMPNEIEIIRLHFDSDENVQTKYGGNYFHATRA